MQQRFQCLTGLGRRHLRGSRVVAALLLAHVGPPAGHDRPAKSPAPSRPGRAAVRLVDVTARTGITFVHRACPSPEKHLPETMGAGVVLLDFDADGDLDGYFVQ